MRNLSRILLVAVLAGGLLAACNNSSSSGSDNTVIATVNGKPITQGMLNAFVRSQTGGQSIQLNDVQRQGAIRVLVNMQLLSDEAHKAGFDDKPEVRDDLAVANNNTLAQLYVEDYLQQHKPSDADMKAEYDQRVKAMDMHEFKARHILVSDESQAKDIIAQLNKGANFAALAKKYSIDPGSKNNGGDLGDWFPASKMVPEFVAGLETLKKGEYTKEPVKTQYGYHVIQLIDERSATAPSFDQMQGQMAQDMQRKAFQDYLDKLRSAAKIDVKNPAPAAGSTAAPAAGTAKH